MQSRYTDRETLMLFCMAYVGKLNKLFVERLQQLGVNAVGLCGADGRSMEGTRKAAIKVVEGGKRRVLRDDFTGRVERVNTDLLNLLLDNGYTPVLCPPALSYDSEIINVDGDRAAAVVAVDCKAETLVILSNVSGLLRSLDDPDSLCWQRRTRPVRRRHGHRPRTHEEEGHGRAGGARRRRRHGHPGRRPAGAAHSPGHCRAAARCCG